MVESSTEPRDSVRKLMSERPLARRQSRRRAGKGTIEPTTALGLEANRQGRRAAGAGPAQSNIPVVGDDGTAISRDGIRPAR